MGGSDFRARNFFSFSRCFAPVSCCSRPLMGTSRLHVAQWYVPGNGPCLPTFSVFPLPCDDVQRGSGGSSAPRFVFSARAALIMRSAAGTSNLVVGTLLMPYGPGGDGGVPAARPERGGGGGTSRTVDGASTIARPGGGGGGGGTSLSTGRGDASFSPGDSLMTSAAGPRMGGGGGTSTKTGAAAGGSRTNPGPDLFTFFPGLALSALMARPSVSSSSIVVVV